MTDPLDPDAEPGENNDDVVESAPAETETVSESTETQSAPVRDNLNYPPMGAGSVSIGSEKTWGSFAHLLSLTGPFTVFIGYVVGPLIVYFMYRDKSPFVTEHSKESLNFGILTAIVIGISVAAGLTALPCIGWIPGAIAFVMNLIFCIQGAIAAKDGQGIRYPFNLRIIK